LAADKRVVFRFEFGSPDLPAKTGVGPCADGTRDRRYAALAPGFVALAGALIFVAAMAAHDAFNHARWVSPRRFWTGIAISGGAVVAACFSVWLGLLYPRVGLQNGNGDSRLGPDWTCRSYGEGATVCLKKVNPPAEESPPESSN
jgi:hypothetical protein